MKAHPSNTIALVAASAILAGLSSSRAAVVSYPLNEHQTVAQDGTIPSTGSNNIDKFDVAGSTAGTVAPFTTTLYTRSAPNTDGNRLARRTQLFLQFDLTGLATGAITSAVLEFDAYSLNDDQPVGDQATHVFIAQLSNDWAPTGGPDPVFNPAITGSPIDGGSTVSGTMTDLYNGGFGTSFRNVTPYSIDVTSIVQNWQGGDTNNGFLVQLDDSTIRNNGLGLDQATVILRVDAVPEPSSLGLLGLAGAAVLLRRRRRS